MIEKGSRVRYIGETNGAYENGKIYVVAGYDEELDAYGVMSDLGEIYAVAEKYLEEIEADYYCDKDLIFRIVKREIDTWNPYSLLPQAPSDEFDSESREITEKIGFDSSLDQITECISEVFSKAFGRDLFTPDKCRVVATAICKSLKKSQYICDDEPVDISDVILNMTEEDEGGRGQTW